MPTVQIERGYLAQFQHIFIDSHYQADNNGETILLSKFQSVPPIEDASTLPSIQLTEDETQEVLRDNFQEFTLEVIVNNFLARVVMESSEARGDLQERDT